MDTFAVQLALLAIAVQANVPVLVWGKPGVAKSSIMAQLFARLGWPLEIILAAIRDQTDFGGLPMDGPEGVEMKAQAWARRLSVDKLGTLNAGLFLEEINQAPPSVQAALMRVVFDKVVGDQPLSQNVRIVAAANPVECSAAGWTLPAPLANRFFHLENWFVPAQNWIDGMMVGFDVPSFPVLPPNWQEKYQQPANSRIASFINKSQQQLHQLPETEDRAGKAWPSHRTWVMAARLLAAAESVNAGDDVKSRIVAGCVGDGAAQAFMVYSRDLDIPDPKDMLANPEGIKWPARIDIVYAALHNMTGYVLASKDKDLWYQGWKVLGVAADKGKADTAAVMARQLGLNKPAGAKTPPEIRKFQQLMKDAQISA
jgi:MoxR-like ATPase